MTPKEKADYLMEQFYPNAYHPSLFYNTDNTNYTKKCALICVDEIIKIGSNPNKPTGLSYWEKVKEEIVKL